MISEEVQLRLMAYFFEISVDDDFYHTLGITLNEIIFRGEETDSPVSDDGLVKIGVKLINDYLDL